jgi:hypothetical protein
VQFSNCINHCHSEADFVGEESASAGKQQIPRAILPRFGMTILNGYPYCTTTLHHYQPRPIIDY